ncbi:MAG: hypothetical protein F9K44_03945 [Hyphomicrobiaceae bacterium]|nr:MAG: hypothetical protein F9K44_03945 [Hyphomicrobiaceae bacterium]
MSSSSRERKIEFDLWFKARYAETQGFTALVLLVAFAGPSVNPISCSYVHVIGDELDWREMRALFDRSGRSWDAVAIFAESSPGGGPLIDLVARARLQERITEVTADRMRLNEAGFFDRKGRKVRIDPVEHETRH